MSSSRRPALLVLVFSVVLAVLAMHHVGAGHDGMAMPPSVTTAAFAPAAAALAEPTAAHPDVPSPFPGPVCLAVLLLGVAALAVGGSWLPGRPRDAASASLRPPSARAVSPPPRDLLAQLCVLRT